MKQERSLEATATGVFLGALLLAGCATRQLTGDGALEEWVKNSKIRSSLDGIGNASHRAGGVKIGRVLKTYWWSPQVGSKLGVAVVHPIAHNSPAIIQYRSPFPAVAGSTIRVVASNLGSTEDNGVLVQIKFDGKTLINAPVGGEWKSVEAIVPPDAKPDRNIVVEVYANDWNCEWTFIDELVVLPPK